MSDPNPAPGTPLDVVRQLVAFLILMPGCALWQMVEDVNLPVASQAKEINLRGGDILFLNIDCQGRLVTPNEDDWGNVKGKAHLWVTQAEIRRYLEREYRMSKESVSPGFEKREPKTVVVIRADRDSDFGSVFKVAYEAKQVGFKRLQIRVLVSSRLEGDE